MTEKETGGGWIDLAGRIAVVSGAASGIGRAAAVALAGAGAAVLSLDRDAAGLAHTVEAIRTGGGTAEALACDVADPAGWDAAAERVRARWGRLDILINAAGITGADRVGDPTFDVYRRIFAVNVEGSLLGMRMALAFMRAAGTGVVLNLSSTGGLRGASTMASYGASKAAIAHYSKSAAIEVARAGHAIRVNSVHPGLIETAMAANFYDMHSGVGPPAAVVAATTLGRAGTAEEVADLLLFLASDRARYISGAEIVIDGGKSA